MRMLLRVRIDTEAGNRAISGGTIEKVIGAFAEQAKDRSGLARMAIREARRQKWIGPKSQISLIGDHPNDVNAARANGARSIAVATGVISLEELQSHSPDILLADLRAIRLDMLL